MDRSARISVQVQVCEVLSKDVRQFIRDVKGWDLSRLPFTRKISVTGSWSGGGRGLVFC